MGKSTALSQSLDSDIARHGDDADAAVLVVSHGLANNYERGFCNGLHDVGVDFILVSSDQTDYANLRPGIRSVNLRGSQLKQRPRWQKLINLLRYHLRLMLWVAVRRPSVVHVMGMIEPPLLVGVLQGLWMRLWSGRYVLTVHDTEPHDNATKTSRRLFAWTFRLASHVVVHTQRGSDELVSRAGVPAPRITVMEHGIEPLRLIPSLPPPGRRPRPFRLLVFGKVMRYKGIDLLIDALNGLPYPVQLTVAGVSVDAALTADLRTKIAAFQGSHNIQWRHMHVPEEDIPLLFLNADALVLAYRRIDQSGVLFQALRYGLPVVATRVGSLEHYVLPWGECCEPDDVLGLRAALLRLIQRYAAVDRAKLFADGQKYEWQRTVQALRQRAYSDKGWPKAV